MLCEDGQGFVLVHTQGMSRIERGDGGNQHHRQDCTLRGILHVMHKDCSSHEAQSDLTEHEEDG